MMQSSGCKISRGELMESEFQRGAIDRASQIHERTAGRRDSLIFIFTTVYSRIASDFPILTEQVREEYRQVNSLGAIRRHTLKHEGNHSGVPSFSSVFCMKRAQCMLMIAASTTGTPFNSAVRFRN